MDGRSFPLSGLARHGLFAGALAMAIAFPALPAVGQLPPDPAGTWQDATIQSGPVDHHELPQPTAMHEWWFFTVQNPDPGPCGPWQAMVAFLRDVEAAGDALLFTAVVDGDQHDFTHHFPPGTMSYAFSDDLPPSEYTVQLEDSSATGVRGLDGPASWVVRAESDGAVLDVAFTEGTPGLWHRRAPEGFGFLEIIFSIQAGVSGSLTLPDPDGEPQVCPVTGTGFFEHVSGDWSRVPMWGVDYLNAHLDGGWSVYARRTPMRGESNLYPFLGLNPRNVWPPVLIVTDGTTLFEASEVEFVHTDHDVVHPQLGVPVPMRYDVTGRDFSSTDSQVDPPGELTFVVDDITLVTIFLETTSSGVLEGWGDATLTVDGVDRSGTSEVEIQRYGTTFPH